MTIEEATEILRRVGALDEYDNLSGWRRGSTHIYLDGEYEPAELEAMAVWMRHHWRLPLSTDDTAQEEK